MPTIYISHSLPQVMQHDLLMMLEHKEFNDIVLKVGHAALQPRSYYRAPIAQS